MYDTDQVVRTARCIETMFGVTIGVVVKDEAEGRRYDLFVGHVEARDLEQSQALSALKDTALELQASKDAKPDE